jgi:hypothetical protein
MPENYCVAVQRGYWITDTDASVSEHIAVEVFKILRNREKKWNKDGLEVAAILNDAIFKTPSPLSVVLPTKDEANKAYNEGKTLQLWRNWEGQWKDYVFHPHGLTINELYMNHMLVRIKP